MLNMTTLMVNNPQEIRETFAAQTPPLSISAAVVADQPGGDTADKAYDYMALGE